MVEYALLLALLSLAAIAIIPQVGTAVNTVFTNANTALAPAQ
jgi:Flp pilus assembly pilin Flp